MTTALVQPEATATITVATPIVVTPGYDVEHPEVGHWEPQPDEWVVDTPAHDSTVYTEGFQASGNGWTGNTIGYSSVGHASTRALYVEKNASPYDAKVVKTVTGLLVGHSYTVRAWARKDSSRVINVTLGVTGTGASLPMVLTSTYAEITYTFTATATSHEIAFAASTNGANGSIYFDDVTLVHHVPEAGHWEPQPDEWVVDVEAWTEHVPPVTTLTPTLPISEGRVTMADDWSPYVQAIFDVPLTDAALSEQIDPKLDQRVTVVAQDSIASTVRTFDLGLRARSIDHAAKTITMELASDEALLMDRKRVATTVDSTPRTYETSLRAICNWALGKIGATLQPGTDDADLTARWTAQNLVPNPGVRNVLGNYIAGGVNASLVRSTGHPAPPVAGLTTYTTTNWSGNSGSGQGGAYNQSGNVAPKLQVSAGKTYNVSLYVSSTPKPMRLMVQVFASDGTVIDGGRQVATITTTTSWQRVSGTITIPAGGAYLGIYIYPQVGQQFVSGNSLVTTGWQVTEGAELLPYFDGSTTAGSGYTYAYAGDANTSASERTPTGPERLPALFDWKPGQSLWDFLQPLLVASGLRLFCDEQRRWYLVNPETYDVPGFVAVQEKHNATRGTDEVTRNDDTWADAVVAVYEWDDADGTAQTAYDVAGDPNGKCVTLTYQREFPGPGAAAYALSRLQGKGRTQEVTALTNYGTTPGQDVQITLPGTLAQTGKVREVIFDLKTGLMDLGTRGLTDAYPGSWALWNPTQTWSAVNATLKWKDA